MSDHERHENLKQEGVIFDSSDEQSDSFDSTKVDELLVLCELYYCVILCEHFPLHYNPNYLSAMRFLYHCC